jgi:hypothetical protein
MVQNNQKTVFYAAFVFWGAIWAPQNQPKKVPKGFQLGEMYGLMSKLKNKPLTKAAGAFLYEKWSKSTRKLFIYAVSFFPEPFGHPRIDPKRSLRVRKCV